MQKTREWLLELLPKLQDISVKEIKMDQLAVLIGKSKSTLYEYFSSKEELLLEMCKTKINQLDDLRSLIQLDNENILDTYVAYITVFANGMSEISIQFLHDMRDAFPVVWAEIQSFMNEIIDDLEVLYQTGIERGVFKQKSIKLLIALDNFFVTQVLTDSSLFVKDPIKLSRLIEEYVDIRLNGLLK